MEAYLQSFYTIRFGDCDPFRHLNNARYIDYFMNAREDHLRENYGMELSEFYRQGRGWVVTRHEIEYVRPASYNESVCICSGLLAAGPEFLFLEMAMLDSGRRQLKALLHTEFTPIDLQTGRKQPHDETFLGFISGKIIPETSGLAATVRERTAYWLQQFKTTKTV